MHPEVFILLFMLLVLSVFALVLGIRKFLHWAPSSINKVLSTAFLAPIGMVLSLVLILATGIGGAYLFLIATAVLFIALLMLAGWLFAAPKEAVSSVRRIGLILSCCFSIVLCAALEIEMVRALPYIRQPSARAKVARAKSEIRNLCVALEMYYMDHNSYPPAVDENGNIVPLSQDEPTVSSGYVGWLLTTPKAYVASILFDPFGPQEPTAGWARTYRYATNGSGYWIVTGRGPDLDWDIEVKDYVLKADGEISRFLTQYGTGTAVEYDPTNGLLSSGDVYRTGP